MLNRKYKMVRPDGAPAGHEDGAGRQPQSAEGGGAASILDKINQKLPLGADKEEVIARKYNCRSVWCSICFIKFFLIKYFKRFSEFPWEETRFLTLTLDRLKVGSAADAYTWFRAEKALGRFIVNLGRQGVVVQDWAGMMEFHRDGTPHWHLLVRTKAGPSGRIGNETLLKAWPWGIVREEYFKNEHHFNSLIGYFGKAGYFHKNKKYQTELPDYFKSDYFKGKKIIRFYGARKTSESSKGEIAKEGLSRPCESVPGLRSMDCGHYTDIFSIHQYDDGLVSYNKYKFNQRLNIPYKDFKEIVVCDYSLGLGLRVFLSGELPKDYQCPF